MKTESNTASSGMRLRDHDNVRPQYPTEYFLPTIWSSWIPMGNQLQHAKH